MLVFWVNSTGSERKSARVLGLTIGALGLAFSKKGSGFRRLLKVWD